MGENARNGYLMLTTDLALISDDDYREIVASFAEDIEVLNEAFSAAWAKLTTSGGMWANNSFCVDGQELNAVSDDDDNDTVLIVSIIVGVIAVIIIIIILWRLAIKRSRKSDVLYSSLKEKKNELSQYGTSVKYESATK